jgi:hypothetical protein
MSIQEEYLEPVLIKIIDVVKVKCKLPKIASAKARYEPWSSQSQLNGSRGVSARERSKVVTLERFNQVDGFEATVKHRNASHNWVSSNALQLAHTKPGASASPFLIFIQVAVVKNVMTKCATNEKSNDFKYKRKECIKD